MDTMSVVVSVLALAVSPLVGGLIGAWLDDREIISTPVRTFIAGVTVIAAATVLLAFYPPLAAAAAVALMFAIKDGRSYLRDRPRDYSPTYRSGQQSTGGSATDPFRGPYDNPFERSSRGIAGGSRSSRPVKQTGPRKTRLGEVKLVSVNDSVPSGVRRLRSGHLTSVK